jgi:transcriptional regulator with XRE-family HTH domain
MEIKEAIAKNIKFLVSIEPCNAEQWGERFGLNKGMVSSYSREVAVMKTETAMQICHAYGISLEDFFSKDLSAFSDLKIRAMKSLTEHQAATKAVKEDINIYETLSRKELIEKATELNRRLLREIEKVEFLTESIKKL